MPFQINTTYNYFFLTNRDNGEYIIEHPKSDVRFEQSGTGVTFYSIIEDKPLLLTDQPQRTRIFDYTELLDGSSNSFFDYASLDIYLRNNTATY